jgi:hypothetical protein
VSLLTEVMKDNLNTVRMHVKVRQRNLFGNIHSVTTKKNGMITLRWMLRKYIRRMRGTRVCFIFIELKNTEYIKRPKNK